MTAAGIEELGLTTSEVRPESTGRDIAIGVGGILMVIAAAIPITWGLLTVGTMAYALVSGFLTGQALAEP